MFKGCLSSSVGPTQVGSVDTNQIRSGRHTCCMLIDCSAHFLSGGVLIMIIIIIIIIMLIITIIIIIILSGELLLMCESYY